VTLLFPNIAVDEKGHQGHWTLIYNQGFEVTINYRKYFAFSYYEAAGDTVVSYCDQTFAGWSHDVLTNNWACYKGKKANPLSPKSEQRPVKLLSTKEYHKADHQLIAAINEKQNHWKAAHYPHLESKTHYELFLMSGGPKSRVIK
jgi:dipeptidyl-peptidase I